MRQQIAWCPGCGNFGILNALKMALVDLQLKPENVLLVSGIGQSSKLPHYLKCNAFNGLHGRILPVATGAKIPSHVFLLINSTLINGIKNESTNWRSHPMIPLTEARLFIKLWNGENIYP